MAAESTPSPQPRSRKRFRRSPSRRGEESQHHVDLLDGERDRAADVLEELRGEIRILPGGGLIRHEDEKCGAPSLG